MSAGSHVGERVPVDSRVLSRKCDPAKCTPTTHTAWCLASFFVVPASSRVIPREFLDSMASHRLSWFPTESSRRHVHERDIPRGPMWDPIGTVVSRSRMGSRGMPYSMGLRTEIRPKA